MARRSRVAQPAGPTAPGLDDAGDATVCGDAAVVGAEDAVRVDLGPVDSVFVVIAKGDPGTNTAKTVTRRQIGAVEGTLMSD